MPDAELTAPYVQALLALPLLVIGLSHLVRPGLWRGYFEELHGRGTPALVSRTFLFELWPATLLVTFHQVWTGPAAVLTVYGHLLMLKVLVALLAPALGMRSLQMAERGDGALRVAGVLLIALGLLCVFLRFS